MRLLVDVLHPAHVHVFKHVITEMQARGHEVVITARRKDVTVDLLEAYGLDHHIISSQHQGTLGLAAELVRRSGRLADVVRDVRPDVMSGIMGPSIAPVGRLLGVPAVVLYDTETSRRTNWWVYRLAHSVVTPSSYRGPVPGRHVTYPGYHELAYLHPDRFRFDPAALQAFGVEEGERFAFVRFVSWQASHDAATDAMTTATRDRLLERLASHVDRVLVSTESGRHEGLGEPLRGPAHLVHHVLAAAVACAGDSATMAAEAAVLGTPAVFVSGVGLGYLRDLEARYGLVANRLPTQEREALDAVDSAVAAADDGRAARARARLVADHVDVTSWLVDWFEREFG